MKTLPLTTNAQIWRTLAAGTALHWVLSLLLGLSPDEAHYALYARYLDWSYYDHPPLVGWLQWPFIQIAGGDWWLRICPMLAWLGTGLGLTILTDQLFPGLQRLTWWGMRLDLMVFMLSPLPHLLGFAWVPDSLLMLFIVWTMVISWHLVNLKSAQFNSYWLLLGILLGLAGLSKYTAFLLAVSLVLCFFHGHGFKWLFQSGPWVAISLAMVIVLPVLYWNIQNDWASFNYQIQHAKGSNTWSATKTIAYMSTIWLALGLIIPVALTNGFKQRRQQASLQRISAEAFSLYFAVPGLLLFIFLSGRGSTLPHWSTPFGVALIPLVARGLANQWIANARLNRLILSLQAFLLAGFLSLMVAGGVSPENDLQRATLPGQKDVQSVKNPFADLFGWEAAAHKAMSLAKLHGATSLGVMNWTMASRLAWYARPWPVKVIISHSDQFDRWFGPIQASDKVLWVDWSVMSFSSPVGNEQFTDCQYLEPLAVTVWGRQIAHFNYSICTGWKS